MTCLWGFGGPVACAQVHVAWPQNSDEQAQQRLQRCDMLLRFRVKTAAYGAIPAGDCGPPLTDWRHAIQTTNTH